MMVLRTRTVRFRLTVWYSAVLLLTICTLSVVMYSFLKASLFHQMKEQIESDLDKIAKIVREKPEELDEIENYSSIRFILLKSDSTVRFSSRDWKKERLPVHFRPRTKGIQTLRSEEGDRFRIKTLKISKDVFLTLGQEEDPVWETLTTFSMTLLLAFPLALALAGFGGYLLAGKMLSPVGVMAEKAKRITADNLAERLPVENPQDEFGKLAGVFNDTLGRLQDSFERLRRFTADASHELRTPLTAIRSVGEVALQKNLKAEEYRDRIGSMLEETGRMTRLVENLLTLTRTDSGRLRLDRRPAILAEWLEPLVEDYRILAEEKSQQLILTFDRKTAAEIDKDTLLQAVINLLDNAIKYTPAGGEIIVSIRKDEDKALIEVADNGPGIPMEHRENIFERFYRIEQARNAGTGGAGLGLAIARQSVEANGGRLEFENRAQGGSLFRIALPQSNPNKKENVK